MTPGRWLRHLLYLPWLVHRHFPKRTLSAIEAAIHEAEKSHLGEIRFAVESSLGVPALLRGSHARQRAMEVFSLLRVWDTEHNTGVLIYLLLADHDVEIVADRGIAAKVDVSEWQKICTAMERAFQGGEFEAGVLAGIRDVGALLRQHFPAVSDRVDELPDRPVVL